jgi:hypothetical protein
LKNDITISEVIPTSTVELASSFLSFESTNFLEQVTFLGLNPKSDFQFADLTYVDFSNSNLHGFDFTGADLRGSTGFNVQWDETTNFKDAETGSSLFSYRLTLSKFLKEHPQTSETINRLARAHWTNAILDVHKLLSEGKNDPNAAKIAEAVFDRTQDPAVKSNILYFMRLTSVSREEHKQFVLNIFACHSQDTSILVSAVRALVALYRNDSNTQTLLLRCLEHPNQKIRAEALNGILSSKHLAKSVQNIIDHVISLNDSSLRRKLVGRVAKILGPSFIEASSDLPINGPLDFLEVISKEKLKNMAERSLIKDKIDTMAKEGVPRYAANLPGSLKVPREQVNIRAREYRALLEEMKLLYKIPFLFES